MKSIGIEIGYGEPLHEGKYWGTFRTVSDSEHAEIVKLYAEEGLSLEKIAEHFKRSSNTPLLLSHGIIAFIFKDCLLDVLCKSLYFAIPCVPQVIFSYSLRSTFWAFRRLVRAAWLSGLPVF